MASALNWFEIPATDIERAITFYNTILAQSITSMDYGNTKMAIFPYDQEKGESGGAIVAGDNYVPSAEGSIVYINCNPDLQPVLDRVEAAGGKALTAKIDLGENGRMAYIIDSEGNKVGLHSNE